MGLLPLYRILLQELLHQVLVRSNIHHIFLGTEDLAPLDEDVVPDYQGKFLAGIAVVLQLHVVETRAGVLPPIPSAEERLMLPRVVEEDP